MPRPGVCTKETRGDFETKISQKARCVVVNLARADLSKAVAKRGEREVDEEERNRPAFRRTKEVVARDSSRFESSGRGRRDEEDEGCRSEDSGESAGDVQLAWSETLRGPPSGSSLLAMCLGGKPTRLPCCLPAPHWIRSR